jgi:cytochrome c oxidase subunit I+III
VGHVHHNARGSHGVREPGIWHFFYWTIHEDFPPDQAQGPGIFWPCVSAALLLSAWALTTLARRWNRTGKAGTFYLGLTAACALAVAGAASLISGPWLTGLDPTDHVYPAIVWTLVIWTVLHIAIGFIMQLYCLARRLAGRMTARHDIDIANAVLYWHFVAVTVVMTVAVIAGFPEVK